MDTVTHRDLRNQSAEVLRRVAAGETLLVTNNGRPAAVIGPVRQNTLDVLRAAGRVRPATKPLSSLRDVKPRESDVTTAEIIRDSRGKW